MGNKHSNYERLLKTPEWREYRKTIFERDNYTCQNCHQKKSADELRVHHKKYIEGNDPWDYPSELVETLCNKCHVHWHKKHKYLIVLHKKPGNAPTLHK